MPRGGGCNKKKKRNRRRRRRALTTRVYGHKSYFKLVTETNGEGREFMSLFIAKSTLQDSPPHSGGGGGRSRKTLLVH